MSLIPRNATMKEVPEFDHGGREVRLLKKKARIAIAANGGDKLGSPKEDLQCEICGENHNTGYCHHRYFPYGRKFSDVIWPTEEEAKVFNENLREMSDRRNVCMDCFIFDHNVKDCPKDEQLKKHDFPEDEQLKNCLCPEDEHLAT